MRELVLVIATIVSTFIAGATFYELYILLWRPELTNVPYHVKREWPRWKTILMYASAGASFIGVGYMIYRGVEGALWFIPKSWRHLNEDGESEWVGHSIAFLVSFYGSVLFIGKLGEGAAEKARDHWENRGRIKKTSQ